jgi:hypothetical protein
MAVDLERASKKTVTKYKIVFNLVKIKNLTAMLVMIATVVGSAFIIRALGEMSKDVTGDNSEIVIFGISVILALISCEFWLFFYREMRESYSLHAEFLLLLFVASEICFLIFNPAIMITSIYRTCHICLGNNLHAPFVQTFITTYWVTTALVVGIPVIYLFKIIYKPAINYFRSLVQIVPVEYEA